MSEPIGDRRRLERLPGGGWAYDFIDDGVRVEARSTFETTVAAREDMTPEWRLFAVNELNIWGEADITVPIVHWTIDEKALLFSKTFPKIDLAIE